jgi:branched-chain amino acid transport system permease protein
MVPFGHGAYFGIGAYTTALIFNSLPAVPVLLTLLIAPTAAFVGAIIIGFFCVRFRGPYFAFSTFAFQMFLFAVALKWRSVTNGNDGMGVIRPELHLPAFGTVTLRSIPNLYYFTLVIVGLGILACYLFLKTPFGNSLVCMRENDRRSSFVGYNVFLTKLMAFAIGGLFAGLSGGLFIVLQEFVSITCIDFDISMKAVFMTILGGYGQFFGPVIGAAFYVVVQDWLSSLTRYWMIFIGVLFIAMVLYIKEGLISLFRNERIRLWVTRLWGS